MTTVTRIGPEVSVSAATSAPYPFASVGLAASGSGFLLVYGEQETSGSDSVWRVKSQLFDASGAKLGSPATISGTPRYGDETYPAVAALGDGTYVVAWHGDSGTVRSAPVVGADTSDYTVVGQLVGTGGAPAGQPFILNTTTANAQLGARVTALSDGNFVAVWDDLGGGGSFGTDVRGQVFTRAGAKVGGEFLLDAGRTGEQFAADVAGLPGGGFVAVWDDENRTAVQRFAANGSRIGAEVAVSTNPLNLTSDNRVATLANGGFVVSWTEDSWGAGSLGVASMLKAQLFSPAGAKSGGVIDIGPSATMGDLEIAGLSGGGFVAAYYRYVPGASASEAFRVEARVFDAAGRRIGDDVVLARQGEAPDVDVVALAGNRFAVSWDRETGAPGASVRTQVLGLSDGSTEPPAPPPPDPPVVPPSPPEPPVVPPSPPDPPVVPPTPPEPEPPVSTDTSFDRAFYLARNPDVAAAGLDPETHYRTYGWIEGRDPNAFFSSAGYIAANPDVRAARLNPFDHYLDHGWREGRDASAAFDTTLYLAANPDVRGAGLNPLVHYLTYGEAEGRAAFAAVGPRIDAGFDAAYYVLANPSATAFKMSAKAHYQTAGWKAGLDPNAYLDVSAYLERYQDVKAAGLDPLDHYMRYGAAEGRDPSGAFDTRAYLAAYTDVAAAGLNPLQHFLEYGVHEGRSAFGDGVLG